MSVEDMTDLIYMHDAYDELSLALFGSRMASSFDEGNFAALSRIDKLIGKNVVERLKENDYEDVWKILENKSIPPEKRAKMLLMK